ncbi:MAG: hypothetical protein K940chlam7_00802 [Chlamydiae bacterium]|nr:hypothetical protein [Chlamydiota bacterium]
MQKALCKLFAIQPGEEQKAFMFAFLGFIWSLAATLGTKYSDALFLIHVGANMLPKIYTFVSCGMIILSLVILRAYYHLSATRIFLTLVSIGIGFYAFTALCLHMGIGTHTHWLWFALRIFSALFLYTMITSFWTFIDQYHKISDAKHLFGLFASMIFLGSMTSGMIMRSGQCSVLQTLFLIVVLLSMTTYWIVRIAKKKNRVDENTIKEAEEALIPKKHSLGKLILSIFTSKYIRLIAIGNFLAFLLWVIAEYNYMSFFEERFACHSTDIIGNEHSAAITIFLGKCVSVTSVLNLFFGLFIYGRLVKRFGVGSVLLFTPLLYLLTFTGWVVNNSSILFPLLGFFVVEGTSEITEDSNLNLLLKAKPQQIKAIARVLIESVFEPLGMLTSGMLLSIPAINSKWIGLTLSLCAVMVALVVRWNYLRSTKDSNEKELIPQTC